MKKTLLYNMSHPSISTFRHSLLVGVCLCLSLFLFASCANPGSGPDGGPFDETPPRIVGMSPMIGQKNTQPKKVTLLFNEIIKLENAAEKVIVSPPQIEMPEIKAIDRKSVV